MQRIHSQYRTGGWLWLGDAFGVISCIIDMGLLAPATVTIDPAGAEEVGWAIRGPGLLLFPFMPLPCRGPCCMEGE